jgi:hypothetical protein
MKNVTEITDTRARRPGAPKQGSISLADPGERFTEGDSDGSAESGSDAGDGPALPAAFEKMEVTVQGERVSVNLRGQRGGIPSYLLDFAAMLSQ